MKTKIFLFYFTISILIFVLISIFAISFGVERMPAPKMFGIEMPTGRWGFRANPFFYLTNEFEGLHPSDYLANHPFIILYWYFLSLIVTLLLYKIRIHRFFRFWE